MLNKWLKSLASSLFVFLPIIEMLRNTKFKDIELFNVALIELVLIVLILTMVALTIYKHKYHFSKILFFIAIVYCVYLFLHCFHIYSFDTVIFPFT